MKKLSMVLFGGNTKKQDGPLLTVADILKRKNCDVTIITDKTHLKLPTKNGKTLQEKLQLSGHNWYEFEKMELGKLKKNINKKSVGFSLNSPWIFKKDLIDFFEGKLYNYHDTPLPKFRGAAAYTWAILQQEKKWGLTIHKIDASLDVGDIVKQKSINFPDTCKIPVDYLNFKTKFEKKFFIQFIDQLITGKKIPSMKQNHLNATYWPRLVTPINGFINWNWNSKQLELFIHAFDDPHQGVSTFIDGKKVRLKKCLRIEKKMKSHPFQAGIIFKKDKEKIFIATSDGAIRINEVYNIKNEKINDKLKLGYRFYTPQKFLDLALSNHVDYKMIKKSESKKLF